MTPERDQQIMDVFLAATELPRDRRPEYLKHACGSDQDLHAEVESLLKHHRCDTLLDDAEGPTRSDDRYGDDRDGDPQFEFDEHRQTAIRTNRIGRSANRQPFVIASLLLAGCFAALWYFAHETLQIKLRKNVESQLRTILNADAAAIEIWLAKQIQLAGNWAQQTQVRGTLTELASLSDEEQLTTAELEQTEAHAQFLQAIEPLLAQPEISFVGVFAPDGHGIAKCSNPPVKDIYWSSRGAALISPCFRGETVFMPTFRPGSNVIGGDHGDHPSAAVSVATPVRSADGKVIAAMQLVMQIDHEFANLFALARMGESGESYAFDEHGIVLSNLRAEAELRRLRLISEKPGAALQLQVRDPGVDLRANPESNVQNVSKPICKVPALAIAVGEAVDVVGYRNYLGREVVGAARWLPEYHFGVVTEIEHDEAFAPLQSLSWMFGVVFGLFASFAIVTALLSIKNLLLRQQVDEARHLGQYTLGELIGQGGMAKVYLASHAFLRRRTAVKLIEQGEAGQKMVTLFEREAQLASELTHPNTISIYDYGQTDEGVFYFAMEYLPGISLAELMIRDGCLPPARAVHLLLQVCGSLVEAHGKGLIHRDVKPANMMLCERGGQFDFVKVLDFGLVQDISQTDAHSTGNLDLTGTPLYIAPERIHHRNPVDGRSDIYSLGTVAFLLLTGRHLFDGETSTDVLYCVVNAPPRRVCDVASTEIPAMLDELVWSCVQKDPDDRPQTMKVVLDALDAVASSLPWTQEEAKNAWGHESAASGLLTAVRS